MDDTLEITREQLEKILSLLEAQREKLLPMGNTDLLQEIESEISYIYELFEGKTGKLPIVYGDLMESE